MAFAGRGRRPLLLAVVAAPVAVLALLALIDLLSGANAHLTRSVLDAGGLGDLADVAQRRLQLSARSFARPVLLAFLPVVLAVAGLAYLKRERLQSWLEGVPALRAGLLGGLAATVVGTLANDSGALVPRDRDRLPAGFHRLCLGGERRRCARRHRVAESREGAPTRNPSPQERDRPS